MTCAVAVIIRGPPEAPPETQQTQSLLPCVIHFPTPSFSLRVVRITYESNAAVAVKNEGRGHGGKRPLARLRVVERRSSQSEVVAGSSGDGEVVHLIVE